MTKYYICDKDNNEIVYGHLDYDKISGFKIKPRNNVKYDGIEVGRLILVEPALIERVLKRKTRIKLNAYLTYLLQTLEEDDDSGNLSLVLDDAKRYKSIIMNKYSKYLDPEYIRELLFRVKFIEEELRAKIFEQAFTNQNSRGRFGR